MHAIDGMACAKRGCDTRGKLGRTIVGPGSFPTKWGRRWRYRCTVCGGTVSTHTGTAYSGLRCARRECDQVASLRVEGVSISATARVTGHSRHTLARWLERASTAAKRFNQRMLRDVAIIELQADARCTFIGTKSSATGLCAAIEVCSRWWAGSVLGRRASRNAPAVLNDVILRGRVVGFPLIATEGFESYVGVSERLLGRRASRVTCSRLGGTIAAAASNGAGGSARRVGCRLRCGSRRIPRPCTPRSSSVSPARFAQARRTCAVARPAVPVAPTSATGTATSCAALTMSSGRTGRCSAVERPGRQRCTPAG